MYGQEIKNCHLQFSLNKELSKQHGQDVHVVDAVPHDDGVTFRQIALIFNWSHAENPSIKIPYYIDAETLEEICNVVQKEQPPSDTGALSSVKEED